MRVAVGTVIYSQAWKWAGDFGNSIIAQTDRQFELLIVNDGINTCELQEFKSKFALENVVVVDGVYGASISQNRILLLTEAKKRKYDILICCDFDDVFSNNRVKIIKSEYDDQIVLYYNNLRLFKSSVNIFRNIPPMISSYKNIEENNFLGLSNTAINLNLLNMEFIDSLEEVDTDIFDWYLFSRIFINKNKGKYIPNVYTYYRQQENNLAGICRKDVNAQKKEIQVKINQYRLLKKYELSYSELYDEYSRLLDIETREWKQYLSCENNGFWWSNFKLGGNSNV